MEAIKKTIKATNGKKTVTATVLYLLFEAFKLWKPDLLSENAEHLIILSINSGMVASLGHKIWRNKKKIYEYIKKKLKSLKSD